MTLMAPTGSRVDFNLRLAVAVPTRDFRGVLERVVSNFISAARDSVIFSSSSLGHGAEEGGDSRAATLRNRLVTLEEALHGSTRQISFRRGASAKIQTYTVKIPKGVREGQRVRLAGQGESSGGGGQAGDLYLRIKFEKHPDFNVSGSDLYYDLEIPVWQAVLGGDAEIPTLDGRAKLHVPPGAQNGQKFRLSGRGLPRKEGGRGNLYAVVQPALPRELTSRERELWKEIASLERGHS
jgi:curved DNA-binding protein